MYAIDAPLGDHTKSPSSHAAHVTIVTTACGCASGAIWIRTCGPPAYVLQATRVPSGEIATALIGCTVLSSARIFGSGVRAGGAAAAAPSEMQSRAARNGKERFIPAYCRFTKPRS